MESVFDHVLTAPPEPLDTLQEVWARHLRTAAEFDRTVDAAVAGGFGADRLGFAFLSGYQEALRCLLPELAGLPSALCATEADGAHPAAIRARLTERAGGWVVDGTKTFVTLGRMARRLVVVASVGQEGERNVLRAALVDATADGVAIEDRPPAPFVPEIPHAAVTFTAAAAIPLPGDGYLDYLKPFRTLEDAHVLAAALGWLLRVARESNWPESVAQRLLAGVAMVRGLEVDRPGGGRTPGAHIALGGVYDFVAELLEELNPLWAEANPAHRARWERDRPLLGIAGRVRAQRLAAAWRAFEG
ncbi:acyl-CoA dehydrogenase family protein [Nocardia panacis]|uniref:Acyl-CoA dehydrogenase family protein n=1 Tax=Nocardia panacis TaxID=2340916 RepID=A0A3A4KQZ8_9NOCA|nr:acyl-CoA dehydrogenase family protein [Nocardia panacis]RJO77012.1 acyl-CoA dehydrogenase family protein [Nocardia panacis]